MSKGVAHKTFQSPRTKSPEEATASLMRLCARAEKCSGDALRLMRRWGVAAEEAQKVLQRLVSERFIDDRRYAEAFVREKSRLSGWGEVKIAATLRTKGIKSDIIATAMAQMEGVDSGEKLLSQLRRKTQSIKYKDAYDLKAKLVRFALSRGFTYDDVLPAVERCLAELQLQAEEC